MIASLALSLVFLSMTTTKRASPSKIRRAAGSKDPSVLPSVIQGWTSQDLDEMASQDGKSALHMAAWQGCLENVQLLLNMGCNVNVIATGDYSYGKTPIFFAATRCRDDIVTYLLEYTNAHVKIVNNKGQSVLSIASSHLKTETIQAVQRAEMQQETIEWQNFRTTHSDGLEYGDLDPRFLERALTPTDVVTPLAVNPTTKQSRRGSFARKNPHVAKEIERRKQKAQIREKQGPAPPVPPTWQEIAQQQLAWESIESSVALGDYSDVGTWLLHVVRFEERQQRSWIPQATERLRSFLFEANDDMVAARLEDAVEAFTKQQQQQSKCTLREVALLDKWIQQVCKAPSVSDDQRPKRFVMKRRIKNVNLSVPPWSTACDAVEGLAQSLLQNPSRQESQLSLPEPPVWVDTEQDLCQLNEMLRTLAREADPCIFALDTEWYAAANKETHASTIQISTVIERETRKQLHTWVVDLLTTNETDGSSSYREMVRELLLWLFDEQSTVTLLGFAFAHDITILRSLCGSLSPKYLDVQRLAAQEMKRGRKTLPGLQACAARYLSLDGQYILSKQEQCSDWAIRPLRDAQLEYAGLDAAVLLVLLAEIANPLVGQNAHSPSTVL